MSFAEQLSRLQAFLDADDLHEEALDYVAAHGYLTALCICPEQVPEREWIDALFAEPPHYRSDIEREEVEITLQLLKAHIARQLASDDEPEIPCELDLGDEPDDSDLRGWCIGFMEGVFLREAVWFEDAEDEVSELLLPIMVASGLFDEQPRAPVCQRNGEEVGGSGNCGAAIDMAPHCRRRWCRGRESPTLQ